MHRSPHDSLTARGFAGLVGLLLLAACGGDDASITTTTATEETPATETTLGGITTTTGGGGFADVDPCDLATSEMVAAAFGGTASDGVPGVLPIICDYAIDGGSSPSVSVYYYGAASNWDGIRSGFESNRGGTTDVPGIGEAAFYPNDAGPTELVVLAGDLAFSVSAGFGGSDEVNADIAELATAIAAVIGG
jgi:hypothetical protein